MTFKTLTDTSKLLIITKYPKYRIVRKTRTLKQLKEIIAQRFSKRRNFENHTRPLILPTLGFSKFPPQANWTNLPTGLGCNGVKIEAVSGLCRVNDRTPVGQLFNQLFTRVPGSQNRFYQQLLHPCDSQSQTSRGGVAGQGRERGPIRAPLPAAYRFLALHACVHTG